MHCRLFDVKFSTAVVLIAVMVLLLGGLSAFAASSPSEPQPGGLVADFSFELLFGPVEEVLGNRRRMVQLATVILCIGLYIVMRR